MSQKIKSLNEVYKSPEEIMWYCCNATGDINLPGTPPMTSGKLEDLPDEARLLYENLWSEGVLWHNLYVMQYNNQFGMALGALFDDDYIRNLANDNGGEKLNIDVLRRCRAHAANRAAEWLAEGLSHKNAVVFFGLKTDPDGDEIVIFIPRSAFASDAEVKAGKGMELLQEVDAALNIAEDKFKAEFTKSHKQGLAWGDAITKTREENQKEGKAE